MEDELPCGLKKCKLAIRDCFECPYKKKELVVVKFRRKEIRVVERSDGSFQVNFAPIKMRVEAGTLRQAFVAFGNALKRVKKEELDKIWES